MRRRSGREGWRCEEAGEEDGGGGEWRYEEEERTT